MGNAATTREPRDALDVLPYESLKAIAQAGRIDVSAEPTRRELIEALAALPNLESLLAKEDRRRIEARLGRMRTRQLRELGERYRVSLHGLTKKSEIVEALADSPAASDLIFELDVHGGLAADEILEAGRESNVDFAKVESLIEQARTRFEERRFEAAIEAAQEAARLAERTTEQLRRSSWSYAILAAQGLLEPCDPADPDAATARELLARAKERFAQSKLGDETILKDLVNASRSIQSKEATAVRDSLAATRDSIQEAANLGSAIAVPEDLWNQAADLLDRGDLRGARENLAQVARLATEARERRIQEVGDALSSVADHIALARNVGADADEAEKLLAQAKAAASDREYGLAGELVKRAERLAMLGQQRQIQKAMELRQSQTEKAFAVVASCEPVIQEAESYGLNVSEARTLLRQARDVLAKGDYVAGLTFARNAEEAVLRLEPPIAEERRRRGILKPTTGICGVCQSRRLHFYDNGWGRCLECGSSFRWRGPAGAWERIRALLGT